MAASRLYEHRPKASIIVAYDMLSGLPNLDFFMDANISNAAAPSTSSPFEGRSITAFNAKLYVVVFGNK